MWAGLIVISLLIFKVFISPVPVVIDLNEYTEFILEGDSGEATFEAAIDWDKVFREKGHFIKEEPFTFHMFPDDTMRRNLERCVFVLSDKTINVTNGDRIHYAYRVSDPKVWNIANVEFKYEPGVYIVSGLNEPRKE